MEKGYCKMSRKLIYKLIIILNALACSGVVFGQSSIEGIYICTTTYRQDTSFLFLKPNNEFLYVPAQKGVLVDICNVYGKWEKKGRNIILIPDINSIEDYVHYVGPYEHTDSIKIKFINYSDKKPSERVVCGFNEDNDVVFYGETNNNGIIVVPKECTHFIGIETPELKGGSYYEVIDFDCMLPTFNDIKIKITRNGLILRKRFVEINKNGKKRYRTYSYRYKREQ